MSIKSYKYSTKKYIMKKWLTLAILALFTITTFAQEKRKNGRQKIRQKGNA